MRKKEGLNGLKKDLGEIGKERGKEGRRGKEGKG